MAPKISLIIPCYNEELVIDETYQRVKQVLHHNNLQEYEILLINDGSKDHTLEYLLRIAAQDQNVKVISFSRNFGHQPAVTAGIHHCSGEVAIIMDADLQDPPELIPEMIKKYQVEKCNVVYGVRRVRKGETMFKKLSAKLYYRFINCLSEVPFPVDTGDFRLIDRQVIEEFKKLKERNKYIRGLVSWIGFKHVPLYYEREPRFAGETKYPLVKMLKFATVGLVYFTKKPLKLAVFLGFLSVLISLILSCYVFSVRIFDIVNTVPGWASTLLIVVFLGGVQLLTIGVMGEYIACIFDEVKERPEYIVERLVNFQ